MTKNYSVKGLNTPADADKLGDELAQIPGFHGVDIDTEAGRVAVSGHGFTDEQVRDAIEVAGFSLIDE